MECDKVRIEFSSVVFEQCCLSCHEDEDMGYGDDLWFTDPNGKDRNVCCVIGRKLDEESAARLAGE